MPGTLVQDSLAPQLLAGSTLNAAGTTNGTIVQVDRPGLVNFELDTGTVASTGNTATLDVTLQGSDSSTFASGVVTYGQIEQSGTDAAQTALTITKRFTAQVYKKYVRAVVVLGGTAPVYTGTVAYLRQPHDRQTPDGTA